MRVTGGVLRGRRLSAPRGDAARPTSDRVREALFSSLGPLEGVRVLDLFAGSGALGIGALSRGAAAVVFVERAARHVRVIQQNLKALALTSQAVVVSLPVARARKVALAHGPVDLVFADPPYAQLDALLPALDRLLAPPLLAPAARLVLEHSVRDAAPTLRYFEPMRCRRYGSTALSYYRCNNLVSDAERTTLAAP